MGYHAAVSDDESKLRPGALVLDLLGDFSRAGGRQIRLKRLVGLGEALGISAPTMRVTLARFRERGWFDVVRDGRESVYRLTGPLRAQLHDGARRIHRAGSEEWTGDWSMVIYTVPEADRQTRDELRKQLVWLGFGPLAPATWVSPHPVLPDIAAAAARLPNARLDLLTTRTGALAADRAMVERCWELDGLGVQYSHFVRMLRTRAGDFRAAAVEPEAAFVERVRLVHEYRGFVRRDPQLPPALQPAGWQGDIARDLFEQTHALLADMAQEYYGDAIERPESVTVV